MQKRATNPQHSTGIASRVESNPVHGGEERKKFQGNG